MKLSNHVNGYSNGDDTEYIIPTSIPQEPVSIQRTPWIPPKDSKLIHPGMSFVPSQLNAPY